MTADAARITLDFDLRKTPIEGLLRADDGLEQPFVGYMQLVTVLEAALGEARQAALSQAEPAQHHRRGELRTN